MKRRLGMFQKPSVAFAKFIILTIASLKNHFVCEWMTYLGVTFDCHKVIGIVAEEQFAWIKESTTLKFNAFTLIEFRYRNFQGEARPATDDVVSPIELFALKIVVYSFAISVPIAIGRITEVNGKRGERNVEFYCFEPTIGRDRSACCCIFKRKYCDRDFEREKSKLRWYLQDIEWKFDD